MSKVVYTLWCEHCLTTLEDDNKKKPCPSCGTPNMKVEWVELKPED